MKKRTAGLISAGLLAVGTAYEQDWGPFAEPTEEEVREAAEVAKDEVEAARAKRHSEKAEAAQTGEAARLEALRKQADKLREEYNARTKRAGSTDGEGTDTEVAPGGTEHITGEANIVLSDGATLHGHFIDGVPDEAFDLTLIPTVGEPITLKHFSKRGYGWMVWTDQANKKINQYTWNAGARNFDVRASTAN